LNKINKHSNNIHNSHNRDNAHEDKHDRGGHPHYKPETILRERLLDAAFPQPTTFAYGAAHIRNYSKREGYKTGPKYEIEHDQVLEQSYQGRKGGDDTDWRVAY
jgi:hypothetical protein